MFDESGPRSRREVIARFDALAQQMFERWQQRTPTAESADWLDQISTAVRIENQAAAAQLGAIGELFRYRLAQSCCETQDWAIDTMAAVAAEVAAGLRISQGLATDRVHYARAMRERLPRTAEVFAAGDIGVGAFSTIVSRTELIVDEEALARVDGLIAANVARWPSLTRGRLVAKVDAIVAKVDADAVRRRKERALEREIWVGADTEGISQITGSLFTVDAHALDQRLSALAATVCEHDPRTARSAPRRRDGGAGRRRRPARVPLRTPRLRRGHPACGLAGDHPRHRLPRHPGWHRHHSGLAVVRRRADHPGADRRTGDLGQNGPPGSPRLRRPRARLHPVQGAGRFRARPRPDVPLARLRRPGGGCDLDHTIPHSQGGKTHGANLKCYCRTHHL